MKIFYTRVVPTFYSTLSASNEDNTSLRSIIKSSKLNVFPSDIVEITNTRNKGIRCHGGDRWWEQIEVSKAKVALLLLVRAVFSMV